MFLAGFGREEYLSNLVWILVSLNLCEYIAAAATEEPAAEEPAAEEPAAEEPAAEEPVAATPIEETVAEAEAAEEVVMAPPPQPPTDMSTVLFDFNSAELSEDAKNVISTHAQFLRDNPQFSITLEGHADERGSDEFNKSLGSKRATAIMEVLIQQGIKSDQISSISYGEEKPAVLGNNDEAWRSNRRAEFVYHQETQQTADSQTQDSKQGGRMLVSDE